ncbi:FMN-binding negative transcriptional regulator [Paeniroseomonas aquatica]|uniref:FMN-binding negative transcriptional regulator n=1 Tax=Paeniroseomonas aquatica TaxID=373043 RepID=A0ABT8A4J7_9PROT|nr:FMN-binding negative transcriptional regulator [Paeniroseomonas aquatica]MDN3564551.1 FMN-binding negative transcriptional regulator [Paeniroseomonas aquatica]
MYNPAAFREDRPEILHGLIRQARLALLVSNGAGGVPDVTHLPLTLDAGAGALIGHVARANPHWQALRGAGRAVAIFRGAEAYVSPNWYPAKAEHHRVVPTWNYEAVHAEGPVEIIEDSARLHAIVTRLTAEKEAAQPRPWAVADAPEAFVAGQLKGIVGLVLRIEALVGKRKMSQNRAAADRDGAAAGLAASEDPRDRDAAAAIRRVAEGA